MSLEITITSMRKRILLEWLKIVLGLIVFAFGVHLTIFANIGLAPWDCFCMGISYHTPLNYGMAMTIMALVILGIDILLKEKSATAQSLMPLLPETLFSFIILSILFL